MRYQFAVLAVLLLIAGGLYAWYPPLVRHRQAQTMLDEMTGAVNSKDRERIGRMLDESFLPEAVITLSVRFYAPFREDGGQVISQTMNMASFKGFVDNLLYPSTDYNASARLQEYTAGRDGEAEISFSAQERAKSPTLMSGVSVDMDYTITSDCRARLQGKPARFSAMRCNHVVHSAPAEGQDSKLRSPEMLQRLLQP